MQSRLNHLMQLVVEVLLDLLGDDESILDRGAKSRQNDLSVTLVSLLLDLDYLDALVGQL